ncbi:hypothetical protein BBJ28_00007029, partial [Nothophytophthora sp. Chile5]
MRLVELYLSAVEKAMTSGNHLLFTQVYMDSGSLERVVNTCGAPAWHRKWLTGYENMLRSLDSTFSDVTLPYWDVFEDASKRISTSTECSDLEACSPFLQDLGGCEGDEYTASAYIVNGETITGGNCANSSVAGYACSSDESDCENCLPRGDWDIDGSSLEFGPTIFVDALRQANGANTTGSALDVLREYLQNSVQLTLHSLLGGVYETRAAAFDPVFVGHYATMDLVFQFFQSCNQSVALTESCDDNDGQQVSSTSVIPMELNGTSVEDHSELSAFFESVGTTFEDLDAFSVQYEVDMFLQNMLAEFSLQCDEDTSDDSAMTYATTASTFEDADAIDALVAAFAVCDQASNVTGATGEAPSTFVACELLSTLQNGVFTNFSTPVRAFFGVTLDDLPKCVDVLAAVTTLEVTLEPSAACQAAILDQTSIDTDDFTAASDGFAVGQDIVV